MKKKKRIICHFTNWLFAEYQVPRIPVRVLYDCDAIMDGNAKCYGYFGEDNGERVILVAAKRIGTTKCLFVVAHEFVHYMQFLNGRNMEETEIIEEDFRLMPLAHCNTFSINIFSAASIFRRYFSSILCQ